MSGLNHRKQNRMEIFKKNSYWLNDNLLRTKGKGCRLRNEFCNAIGFITHHTYDTEEEEYEIISRVLGKKFGRGLWNIKYLNSFPIEIQDIIKNEIANTFGAFDY